MENAEFEHANECVLRPYLEYTKVVMLKIDSECQSNAHKEHLGVFVTSFDCMPSLIRARESSA